VRIPSAKRRLDAYPHEMSGGMRQRAIDRAGAGLQAENSFLRMNRPRRWTLPCRSRSCCCCAELQREFGMSVISFVTHDIGVAIEICDRVAVMYAGEIVEQGSLSQIVRSPVHPYAKGLLASTVHGAKRGQRLETIRGRPTRSTRAPTSCSFAAALRFCATALRRAIAAQRADRARADRAMHFS